MKVIKKKSIALSILAVASLSLTACSKKDQDQDKVKEEEKTVEKVGNVEIKSYDVKFGNNDDNIYENHLKTFYDLLNEAESDSVTNSNERYVRMAKAEAALLDSAVMIPTTTRGGNYALTRIAPRTIAYTFNGNDDDKLKNLVLTAGGPESIIKTADRDALLDQWQKAKSGQGTYDPAGYLSGKGYTIGTSYTSFFSTKPTSLDVLNTSSQADSESLVNCVEGLVEYDNFGIAKPTSGVDWEVSSDGKTYTFTVPSNNPWVNNEGNTTTYGNVTAQDYVDGFQHMLDAGAGSEWMVSGVIVNVQEYLDQTETDFSKVGFRAIGSDKVEIKLVNPEPFFPTRLAYSLFSPINRSFFESKGGVLGKAAFTARKSESSYTYGKVGSPADMIYCGAFYVSTHTASDKSGEIVLTRNTHYHRNSETTLNTLRWVYDGGENPEQMWNTFKNGTYTGIGLSSANGNLDRAKNEGLFDNYKYVTDTESTSYFGGLNLNRQTFEQGSVKSKKSKELQEFWQKAVQSKNIRKAILYGFDKASYNGTSVGEDLKLFALRNMYTKPDFVLLSEDVELDGHKFAKGSTYGEVCQYYCDQLGLGLKLNDGVDGWYNPEAAKKFLERGKADLKAAGVDWNDNATVEWVYYSASVANTATANTWAQNFNKLFEGQGIKAELLGTDIIDDYYAVGYRAGSGRENGMDLFAGSGWGPDYADPSTYLDTFKPAGDGYMTKTIGLY